MEVMETRLHPFVMILGRGIKYVFCPELLYSSFSIHHKFLLFFFTSCHVIDSTCFCCCPKLSGCWTNISQEEENWAWTRVVHSTRRVNRRVCPARLLFSTEHNKYNKTLQQGSTSPATEESHFTKPPSLV